MTENKKVRIYCDGSAKAQQLIQDLQECGYTVETLIKNEQIKTPIAAESNHSRTGYDEIREFFLKIPL
jgi:hypothetical protein